MGPRGPPPTSLSRRRCSGRTAGWWSGSGETRGRSSSGGRSSPASRRTSTGVLAEGIPVVRRVTAGGAVYNGPGNINWSLFVGREFKRGRIRYIWGVREVFRMAADLVVEAAAACGVRTWLDEPNRIRLGRGEGKRDGRVPLQGRAALPRDVPARCRPRGGRRSLTQPRGGPGEEVHQVAGR